MGTATPTVSRRTPSGLLRPLNRQDWYSCHLGLLALVTRAEYSCTTLHERGGCPRILLLGSSESPGVTRLCPGRVPPIGPVSEEGFRPLIFPNTYYVFLNLLV